MRSALYRSFAVLALAALLCGVLAAGVIGQRARRRGRSSADLTGARLDAQASPLRASRAARERRARHERRISARLLLAARERQALVFAQTQQGPFDDLILVAARRWKLDPFLFKGLLANESELDPSRVGKREYASHDGRRLLVSGGAVGIAQFTAAGVDGVNALRARRRRNGALVLAFDLERARVAEEAIPAAAELLAHLINRFGRDGGITAYNSGGAGGRAVSRLGFWRARHAGRLQRSGRVLLQGNHFLINVLARASWYREEAGLDPLYEPDILHPDSQRYITRGPASGAQPLVALGSCRRRVGCSGRPSAGMRHGRRRAAPPAAGRHRLG